MNPNDINVLMLESVAQRLGNALLGELVFVGGAVAGLLITDPAMPAFIDALPGHLPGDTASQERLPTLKTNCVRWHVWGKACTPRPSSKNAGTTATFCATTA